MAEQKISEIMETAMDKIKTMVDADTIIGEKIVLDDVTIIPVSKMSFGFASGASDIGGKGADSSKVFAGGGGAGASITPIGFLAVSGENVKMIPVTPIYTPVSTAIEMLPEVFEKVKALFKKENKENTENKEKEASIDL